MARTAIGANRKQLGSYHIADHMVSLVLSLVMPWLGQPAAQGALPTMFVAAAPDAQRGGFYGPDGFAEMKRAPAPARIKPAGQDMAATARLWQVSKELTGFQYPF